MTNKTKINKALHKLLKKISRSRLTTEETVLLLGNLVYRIGAALDEKNQSLSLKEIMDKHNNNPTLSTFLMNTGVNISACVSDIEQQTQENKKEE
jgi:hypothetical protein